MRLESMDLSKSVVWYFEEVKGRFIDGGERTHLWSVFGGLWPGKETMLLESMGLLWRSVWYLEEERVL